MELTSVETCLYSLVRYVCYWDLQVLTLEHVLALVEAYASEQFSLVQQAKLSEFLPLFICEVSHFGSLGSTLYFSYIH